MAWISIHEQVTGSKLRKFAKAAGCTQNEALGLLVRLWLWCIKNIGQDGILDGMERYDLAEIINIGLGKTYDPERIVDAMIDTGWVDEKRGKLRVHNWEEWQRYYYSYSKRNKADAVRKRNARSADEGTESEEQEVPEKSASERKDDAGTEKTGGIDGKDPKSSKSKTSYTDGFEAFWKVYPRKKEKGSTFEKYKARINDGFDDATLLAAATAYRDECQRRQTEEKYIKLGKTFLSNSLPFVDYVADKTQMMSPGNAASGNGLTAGSYGASGISPAAGLEDDPFGDWR